MIEHKTCNMSNRFWAQGRSTTSRGARADDHQIGSPFSRALHNFTFGPSLALQGFRSREVASSFVEDILRRCSGCLTQLFAPGHRRTRWSQEALTLSRYLCMWATINHVDGTKRKRIRTKHSRDGCVQLFDVRAIQAHNTRMGFLLWQQQPDE